MVSIKCKAIVLIAISYLTFVTANRDRELKQLEYGCLKNLHRFFMFVDIPEQYSDLEKLDTLQCVKKAIYHLSEDDQTQENTEFWKFYHSLGYALDKNSDIQSPEQFCYSKHTHAIPKPLLCKPKLSTTDINNIKFCEWDLEEFKKYPDGVLFYAMFKTKLLTLEYMDNNFQRDNRTSYMNHIVDKVKIIRGHNVSPKSFCKEEAIKNLSNN